MDELPESLVAGGAFDERAALAELDRIRQEIARYQALRAGVNEEFERFVQSFKKPGPLEAPVTYSRPAPPPPVRVEAPPVADPVEPAPVLPPVEEAPAVLPVEPIAAAPEPPPPLVVGPPPPVIEALPATAEFEPLNLEPFAKQFESAPTEIEHPPAHTQAVPTSPEAFEGAPEADGFEEGFAPAEAFDSLPPPLEPMAVIPPPPVEAPQSHARTWFVVAGAIAIISVGGYVWTQRPDDTPVVVSQDPVPAAVPVTPPPATASETAPAPAAVPAEPPAPFELVTTSAAWVRVLADGARVVERELPADSRIPITAQKTVQIRTGNAGAVRVSIAGVDQGALGREGEVVNRTFTIPAIR